MNPADKIKGLIKNSNITVSAEADSKILADAMTDLEQLKSAPPGPNIWRIIMKSRIIKPAIAVIILCMFFGVILFEKTTTPAWAVYQTMEAFNEVKTLIVSGTSLYYTNEGEKQLPFKAWIRFDSENSRIFMRYESEKEIVVVQNNNVYMYDPDSRKLKIAEGDTIEVMKFWYKTRDLSPWLTGKMFNVLKLNASEWKEEYKKDPQTGRELVFVACSYKKYSTSFQMVFDVESKLIVRAEHFRNPNLKGSPNLDVKEFIYNPSIPEETFVFDMTIPAEVVVYQDTTGDRDKAWELFEQKKYQQSLELYQKTGDLMMIGICYANMEQYDKAIEAYEKKIRILPDEKGSMAATYFYLGSAYSRIGDNAKAIKAFENCLQSGKGFRDPNNFPLKNAREEIEKLKK